jgi:hypothetical protein
MVKGQPCGIAGKNIRNSKTKEYAWVDIKGYKHVYTDALWKTKSSTCETDVIVLSDTEYNAIPNGGNMNNTDTCNHTTIDPDVWNQLIQQNDELLQISKELSDKFKSDELDDTRLQETIQKVTNERDKLYETNKHVITIDAEQEHTYKNQRMQYLHMMVWFTVLIIMIGFIINTFINTQSSLDTIFILLIILLIIITKWI